MVPVTYYLVHSLLLFTIGAAGVMIRRNAIVVFMCIELMLNSVNMTFAAFSKANAELDGQIAVFFVIVIAAAEAAVGLACILSVFRNFKSVQTSETSDLRY